MGLALLLLFIGSALQALVSVAPVFEAERLLAANPTAALAETVQTDNHEPEATSHSEEEHGRPHSLRPGDPNQRMCIVHNSWKSDNLLFDVIGVLYCIFGEGPPAED